MLKEIKPSLRDNVRIPKPPEGEGKDIGAHISLLDQRETDLISPAKIQEVASRIKNKRIQFDNLLEIKKLKQTGAADHLWILEIISSQLEEIREKEFGLSRKPNNNRFEFHLSIAEVPLE